VHVQQITVKYFTEGPVDQAALIPVFHRWIREDRITGKLLIDVADYRQVQDGPGVMLIAHEAHYGLDEGGGRPGLRMAVRRDEPRAVAERLTQALRDVLFACAELEKEESLDVSFAGGEVQIQVLSRLHAPNTAATFAAFREAIAPVLATVYGEVDV